MSKLEQIRTALNDGACESVTVNTSGGLSFTTDFLNIQNGVIKEAIPWNNIPVDQIESFTVNLRKFDDLGVGDLVMTPNGRCAVECFDSDIGQYLLIALCQNANEYDTRAWHYRHELVLLQRAGGDE